MSHLVYHSFYKPYFLKLKLLLLCVILPNWLWYPHVAAWPKALVFLVSLSSKTNVNWEEFFFFFPLAKIWIRLALRNNAESSFLPHIYDQCPAFPAEFQICIREPVLTLLLSPFLIAWEVEYKLGQGFVSFTTLSQYFKNPLVPDTLPHISLGCYMLA